MQIVIDGRLFEVQLDGDMFVVADEVGERGRVFVGELTRPPGPVYIEPDPEPGE